MAQTAKYAPGGRTGPGTVRLSLGRTGLIGALLLAVLVLTGCVTVQLDATVHPDGTLSGTARYGVAKSLAAFDGGQDQVLAQLRSEGSCDFGGNQGSTKDFDDGTYIGIDCSFNHVTMAEFNSGEAGPKLSKDGDQFHLTGNMNLLQTLSDSGTGLFGSGSPTGGAPLPSGIPTDLSSLLPSGFPTDLSSLLPSGIPTDLLPSGIPTDLSAVRFPDRPVQPAAVRYPDRPVQPAADGRAEFRVPGTRSVHPAQDREDLLRLHVPGQGAFVQGQGGRPQGHLQARFVRQHRLPDHRRCHPVEHRRPGPHDLAAAGPADPGAAGRRRPAAPPSAHRRPRRGRYRLSAGRLPAGRLLPAGYPPAGYSQPGYPPAGLPAARLSAAAR